VADAFVLLLLLLVLLVLLLLLKRVDLWRTLLHCVDASSQQR
jgi:hypothetical protein